MILIGFFNMSIIDSGFSDSFLESLFQSASRLFLGICTILLVESVDWFEAEANRHSTIPNSLSQGILVQGL